MSQRLRNFCFTQHDVTKKAEIEAYECKYLIVGVEVCPTTKKQHLQGYCELGKQLRLLELQKTFGHIEERKGTAQQASDYCEKEGNFVKKGTLSRPGTRSDLKEVAKSVLSGASIEEIAETHPVEFIKYNKGIEALRNTQMKHRTTKPHVEWLWGLTEVGKSRYCNEKHTSKYFKDGTMWWNNYTQQEAIIIDDFDGKWPFRDLLRILDRYEYQGQTKGGYVKINSPYIYITCEFPPTKFWCGNELDQIVRRIDLIRELKKIQASQELGVSEVGGNNVPHLTM